MARVAQLDKVLAGVGLFDGSVRDMLDPQHPFVLALHAGEVAHTDVRAKVEGGGEMLVAAFVQVVGQIAADTGFHKPGVLAFAVKAQHGLEAEYRDIAAARFELALGVPHRQAHVPVRGHGVAPPIGVPAQRDGGAHGQRTRTAFGQTALDIEGRGLAHVCKLRMRSAAGTEKSAQASGGDQGTICHATDVTCCQ